MIDIIPTPAELKDWDRRHYWHAFTQMAEYEPLVIARAEGCRLYDVDGNEFIDGVGSMWCNVHGHCHPAINAAIQTQLAQLPHCTSLGMGSVPAVQLAKRLADLAPGNLNRVFFASDGSSAIETAIKMAFQYWWQRSDPRPAKTKYVALGGAYHGDTLGSASVGGIARFHAMFEPLLFDVIRLPIPDPRRLPAGVGQQQAAEHFLAPLEGELAAHHKEIAALVIEPIVQCAAGIVIHPEGYLRGVRELTRKYGVLLITDEVATGMGRTGTLFACEQEDVVPDFLCLGKGITGGTLPLSATITTEEIYEAFLGEYAEFKTLFHGHTYGGNALAAAAALATFDLFDEEQTLENLLPKIARLGEHLCRLAEHPHIAHARQKGFVGAIDLVRDKASGEPYPWSERRGYRAGREALRHGVWLRPLGDTIYVMPPLAIGMEDLDRIMEVAGLIVDNITKD